MKKADNFDSTKWLVENKITTQSRLNENEYSDIDAAFLSSPKTAPYNKVLDHIKSYNDKKILKSFTNTFPEGEPISKSKYWNWLIKSMVIDGTYIKKNWVSISNLNEVGFNQYGEPMGFDDEEDYEDEDFDIDAAFGEAPNKAPYSKVLDIVKSYEDNGLLKSFTGNFPKGKPVSKDEFLDWNYQSIDDMSEVVYIKANWISMFDEDIFDKAGLAF